MKSGTNFPGQPPHLSVLFPRDSYVFFVTQVTSKRNPILANPEVHDTFLAYARNAHVAGGTVTHYVIMPDHLHFFIGFGRNGSQLERVVTGLKRALGKVLSQQGHPFPHWQPGFFDHLLRHTESYAQRADYIWNNPVRKGLAAQATDWPFLGIVTPLPVNSMILS